MRGSSSSGSSALLLHDIEGRRAAHSEHCPREAANEATNVQVVLKENLRRPVLLAAHVHNDVL